MITHIVILWLKDESADMRRKLLDGAAKLGAIPGVLEFRTGGMIPGTREIVDNSFAVGLSMTFPDQAAADYYQEHPIHQEFVEKYVKPLTSRVVVYDFGTA